MLWGQAEQNGIWYCSSCWYLFSNVHLPLNLFDEFWFRKTGSEEKIFSSVHTCIERFFQHFYLSNLPFMRNTRSIHDLCHSEGYHPTEDFLMKLPAKTSAKRQESLGHPTYAKQMAFKAELLLLWDIDLAIMLWRSGRRQGPSRPQTPDRSVSQRKSSLHFLIDS